MGGDTGKIVGTVLTGSPEAYASDINTRNQLDLYQKYNQPQIDYRNAMLDMYTQQMEKFLMPYAEQVYPEQLRLATQYQLPLEGLNQQLQRDYIEPQAQRLSDYLYQRGFEAERPPEVIDLPTGDSQYQTALQRVQAPYGAEQQAIIERLASEGMDADSPAGKSLLASLNRQREKALESANVARQAQLYDLGNQNTQFGYEQGLRNYQLADQAQQARDREIMAYLGLQQPAQIGAPAADTPSPSMQMYMPTANTLDFGNMFGNIASGLGSMIGGMGSGGGYASTPGVGTSSIYSSLGYQPTGYSNLATNAGMSYSPYSMYSSSPSASLASNAANYYSTGSGSGISDIWTTNYQ